MEIKDIENVTIEFNMFGKFIMLSHYNPIKKYQSGDIKILENNMCSLDYNNVSINKAAELIQMLMTMKYSYRLIIHRD